MELDSLLHDISPITIGPSLFAREVLAMGWQYKKFKTSWRRNENGPLRTWGAAPLGPIF